MPQSRILLTLAVMASSQPSLAQSLLQDGTYEISVSLELPFIDDRTASSHATRCLSSSDAAGTNGLAVLSANNPLGHCPASQIQRDGDMLTFNIACPGGNAAIGSARYTLYPDRFEGRIGCCQRLPHVVLA